MLLQEAKKPRMEAQANLGLIFSAQKVAAGKPRVALEVDILHAKGFGNVMKQGNIRM
jgi:hypothetical protein